MRRQILTVAALALAASGIAEARENRVLKCHVARARAAKSTGGPALIANVPRSMTPIDLNAVQMTDKRVVRKVVVEGLFARRTPTDTVEVVARLVNCTSQPLRLAARSSFMDQAQLPIETVSAWQAVFLQPYATGVYRETSTSNQNVANYLIELRDND
jgi:hypothetical protein